MKFALPFLFCLSVAMITGCQPTEVSTTDAGTTPVSHKIEVAADLNPRLAAADAADGAEDQIVSKCYSCQLAMKGKEEIATQVNDYTVHFCSENCRTLFEGEAAKMIGEIEATSDESSEPHTHEEGEATPETPEADQK